MCIIHVPKKSVILHFLAWTKKLVANPAGDEVQLFIKTACGMVETVVLTPTHI